MENRSEREPLPEGLIFHCRSSFKISENYYFSILCLSLFTYRSTLSVLHISRLCYINERNNFFFSEIIVIAPASMKTRICQHICDFIVLMMIVLRTNRKSNLLLLLVLNLILPAGRVNFLFLSDTLCWPVTSPSVVSLHWESYEARKGWRLHEKPHRTWSRGPCPWKELSSVGNSVNVLYKW